MNDNPTTTCKVCGVPVEMRALEEHEATCKRRAFCGVEVIADPMCPPDRIYYLPKGYLERAANGFSFAEQIGMLDIATMKSGIDPDKVVADVMAKVNEMLKKEKPS